MNGIYMDYMNNIWEFFINSTRDLCYRIMYGTGKWTKNNLLDKDVSTFDMYVDEDEEIHIIYSKLSGEIKYCTMKNKKWLGRTIVEETKEKYEVKDLKVEIINAKMHIIYLKIDKLGNDHGLLVDCIWDGRKVNNIELQDVIVASSLKANYLETIVNENGINLYFITDEGDELSLNKCSFENNKWSQKKRLYGIQGKNISFSIIKENYITHIINKSTEEGIYLLEHIYIDINGKIKDYKLYESNNEIKEPILFLKNNRLNCCFIENSKVYYSTFDNNEWSFPILYETENEDTLEIYKCFMYSDIENSIVENLVYLSEGEDFIIYVPKDFKINNKLSSKIQKEDTIDYENREFARTKLELLKEKAERKNLEEKIHVLNIQLQKMQKYMEEYEEKISLLSEQKRKVDENYNVFIEFRQNIQKDLDDTQKLLTKEVATKNEINNKMKILNEELKEKNGVIEDANILIISLKNEINDLKKIIKNQEAKIKINEDEKEALISEKNKLASDLEIERNQTIMGRLLRKKTGEI